MQRFNNPVFHCALLIFIVFLLYAHTFDAGFMFDDYAQQEMLKLISRGQREVNIFNFSTTPEEATYYTQMTAVPWWTNTSWRLRYFRPVATLSHLFDYTLWHSNPLNYAGTTTNDSDYQVLTDFLQFDIPKIYPEMIDSFYVINHAFKIIADKLVVAGASTVEYQIVSRYYFGEPVQGQEFGFLTFNNDAQIDKVSISTADVIDNNLVLDIAIDSVYQALDLTLPAGSSSVQSADLTYVIAANDIVKFKWKTVTLPAGYDFFVDITWHATTALSVRYDFIRTLIGELQVNKIMAQAAPRHQPFFFCSTVS